MLQYLVWLLEWIGEPRFLLLRLANRSNPRNKALSPLQLTFENSESEVQGGNTQVYSNRDIENILSKYGGNYQPDFGQNKTIMFENNKLKQNGWSILLENISGNSKNQRLHNIIKEINKK